MTVNGQPEGQAGGEQGGSMEDKAIITIVIDGANIMGHPLCKMDGIIYQKGKRIREISYNGPITSAKDVGDAIQTLFKEDPA